MTLRDPRAIPLAALVLVLLQLATLPLANTISRRYEAEADWQALQLTGDPTVGGGALPSVRADEPDRPRPALAPARPARHASVPARAGGYSSRGGASGRSWIPRTVAYFDHESVSASSNSFVNRVDMFTRDTTTPGISPSSIPWSIRTNVTVNS